MNEEKEIQQSNAMRSVCIIISHVLLSLCPYLFGRLVVCCVAGASAHPHRHTHPSFAPLFLSSLSQPPLICGLWISLSQACDTALSHNQYRHSPTTTTTAAAAATCAYGG